MSCHVGSFHLICFVARVDLCFFFGLFLTLLRDSIRLAFSCGFHSSLATHFHLDLSGAGLLHHSSGLVFLARKEVVRQLFVLLDDCFEFLIFFQIKALQRGFDVLFFNAGLVEEIVVSLELLNFDNGVDHLRGDALRANELVHLFLGFKLSSLKSAHGVQALLTGQLLGSTTA